MVDIAGNILVPKIEISTCFLIGKINLARAYAEKEPTIKLISVTLPAIIRLFRIVYINILAASGVSDLENIMLR